MRLYVSGPMSGIENFNFPLFNQVAEQLREAGHIVSNPAEKGAIDGWQWEDYLAIDLIEVCNLRLPFGSEVGALVLLPGWENSPGAVLEQGTATMLKIPTPTLEEFLSEQLPTYASV